MAQYKIDHQCGHVVTHDLTGTNVRGQRTWRAGQLAKKPCPDCARNERATNHAAVSEMAAEAAAADGLPALTGSEQQVAWATTLRADALVELDEWSARTVAKAGRPERTAALMALYRDVLLRQTSAREWINTRTVPLHQLYGGPKPKGEPEAGTGVRRRVAAWMTDADRATYDQIRSEQS